MLSDIEYNFVVTKIRSLNGILVSFDYHLCMYYKDERPGHYIKESKTYFMHEKCDPHSVEDLCDALIKKEKVTSLEEVSIFKHAIRDLSSSVVECNWSLTNVSKFD